MKRILTAVLTVAIMLSCLFTLSAYAETVGEQYAWGKTIHLIQGDCINVIFEEGFIGERNWTVTSYSEHGNASVTSGLGNGTVYFGIYDSLYDEIAPDEAYFRITRANGEYIDVIVYPNYGSYKKDDPFLCKDLSEAYAGNCFTSDTTTIGNYVSFYTNRKWCVTSDQEWCEVFDGLSNNVTGVWCESESSDGSGVNLTVKLAENMEFQPRECVITVEAEGCDGYTYRIVQQGKEEKPYITLSASNWYGTHPVNSHDITVYSNCNWDVEVLTNKEFIDAERRDNKIHLSWARYRYYHDVTSIIKVFADGCEPQYLYFTRAGGTMSFGDQYHIDAKPSSFLLTDIYPWTDSSTGAFVSWTATTNSDAITLSAYEGTKTLVPIYANCLANDTGYYRDLIVTIETNYENKTSTNVISITQPPYTDCEGITFQYTVDCEEVSLPVWLPTYDQEDISMKINVPDWIEAQSDSTYPWDCELEIDANSGAARQGTVVCDYIHNDGYVVKSRVIEIIQCGADGSTIPTDTRSPYINPITSSAGEEFVAGTEVTFSTSTSDDVALSKIELFIDDDLKATKNISGLTGEISYTISTLAVGEHTIKVVATDASGLTNNVSLTIVVNENICNHTPTSGATTYKRHIIEQIAGDNTNHNVLGVVYEETCNLCGTPYLVEVTTGTDSNGKEFPYKAEHSAWDAGKCGACGYVCQHDFKISYDEDNEPVYVPNSGRWVMVDEKRCKKLVRYMEKCTYCEMEREGNTEYEDGSVSEHITGTVEKYTPLETSDPDYHTMHLWTTTYQSCANGCGYTPQNEPTIRRREHTMVNGECVECKYIDDYPFITKKTGQFKYPGYINQVKDSTATYVYSDSYFDNDSTKYNPQLATMSLCLELSAWSSYDTDIWSNKTKNVKALLEDIGFKDIEQNEDWNTPPSMHSIGVVTAHKNIGDSTVVALVVRGGNYADEWGGNFVLGKQGNHAGFENGRIEASSELEEYVLMHQSKFKKKLKVWIVGFSRGGAVANLVAGKLSEYGRCGGMDLPSENIFAYTFEAPQGHVGYGDYGYDYIHNHVNSMDIVPLVAPKVMGFKRYNEDSIPLLPTLSTDAYKAKIKEIQSYYDKVLEGVPKNGIEMDDDTINFDPSLHAMKIDLFGLGLDATLASWNINTMGTGAGGYKTYVDIKENPHWIERNKGLTVDRMLSEGIDSIFGNIPDGRVGYVNDIEQALSNLVRFFMNHNEIDWSAVVYDAFFANYAEGARKVVGTLINPFTAPEKRIADGATIASQLFDAALKQTGTNLNETIPALTGLLKAVFSAIIDDPQQLFGLGYYFVGDNGFQPHWPEVSLAAMMAVDPNYNPSIIARSLEESPQSYRIVQINCPVDVAVYDDNQQLMSQIVGDTASNTSQVHGAFITETGTKQVVLPSDAAYSIRINATGDGEMSVSVLEYNSVLQQTTLLQGWQNISISTGDNFIVDIPAYALKDYKDLDGNGSATAYKLTGPTGRSIEPTLLLKGDDVEYHQVTLTSNNQKGIVTGGGQFVKSGYAQVQAIGVPTVEFLGWYRNGICVSTDETYRFAVNDDVNLVAHFTEGNFNRLSVTATAGGKVNIDEMQLPESVKVQLIAEPDPGFEFDRWEVTAGSVENAQSITTIFTMPASDASITAVFKNSNALTITQQPIDQFVVVGQAATFSIGATGDNLIYQWYIDRNDGRGWRKLDNAVGSEYTTSVVGLECDGFKYYCKITDQYGNNINSNEAVLHVSTAPMLPETGDSSTPVIWLTLSMMSMLGILLMRKKACSE